MLRDITIGQYYAGTSALHRMDPRVKLFGTMVFLVSVFAYQGIAGLLVVTAFLALVIRISQVPFRYMTRGLRAIVLLMLFTALFNLFLTPGRVLVQVWVVKITAEGVTSAVRMMIRLTYLILGTSLMTLTTTPNQLTDGLEKALKLLNRIRVPVHEIAMMMSIALRFIPILIEETDKIMKAQMARGASFDEGNILQRAKSMIPLLVPLFISAFRRANDLAMAMESRCYRGGDGRTKMKPLRYQALDYRAYAVLILYLALLIVLRVVL